MSELALRSRLELRSGLEPHYHSAEDSAIQVIALKGGWSRPSVSVAGLGVWLGLRSWGLAWIKIRA